MRRYREQLGEIKRNDAVGGQLDARGKIGVIAEGVKPVNVAFAFISKQELGLAGDGIEGINAFRGVENEFIGIEPESGEAAGVIRSVRKPPRFVDTEYRLEVISGERNAAYAV